MSSFNRDADYSPQQDSLIDGERVVCMLFKMGIPKHFIDSIAAANKRAKENAEAFGLTYIPKQVTYKDTGIEWYFAVIRRSRGTPKCGEEVIKYINGELVPPRYTWWGKMEIRSPLAHKEWKKAKGDEMFYIGDMNNRAGTRVVDSRGNIQIGQLFPSIKPPEEENDLVKWTNTWNKIIDDWNTQTEEECLETLNYFAAKRFMLRKMETIVDDVPEPQWKLEYVPPRVGILFHAVVSKVKGNDYFNVISWDKENKTWNVLGSGRDIEVSESAIQFSQEIKKVHLEYTNAAAAKAKMKAVADKKSEEDSEDEVPF